MKRRSCAHLAAIVLALTTVVTTPTGSFADAGTYLATRQAVFERDFVEQARYATQTLVRDSKNVDLLETLVSSKMSLGAFEDTYGYALMLDELDTGNQIAAMALTVKDVHAAAWDEVIARIEGDRGISQLVDDLTKAWAYVGAGDMTTALELFDQAVESSQGFGVYAHYNRAIAMALVGDYEGGVAVLSDAKLMVSEQAVLARVQMLSQLERNDEALAVLTDMFAATTAPHIASVRDALSRGETLPFNIVSSAREGVAGVFQTVATVVDGGLDDGYTLLYARIALELHPERTDCAIFVAGLLERMEHFDIASNVLASVDAQEPLFLTSELARARVLGVDGQAEAQISVLNALAENHPQQPEVFSALGDALRRAEKYDEAAIQYSAALDLTPDMSRERWPLLFVRGTTFERNDKWDLAEADFRAALEIAPGQPRVLNYMGYAFLEMNTNLDEAMQMIRAASAARPDDGYITDSLAWGLYRLRQFKEAVAPMEKAAQLMPVDPIINDHLGDVFWAVGRYREAEFQWKRALSFDPEEAEVERIRAKLLFGLDVVLIEEGKEPTQVPNDDE